MKLKEFKNGFSCVGDLIKLKPILFASVAFSLIYGLVTSVISTLQLSFFIGVTGSYSLILGYAKLYGLSKYKLIKSQADIANSKEIEKQSTKNIAICASVISFLHFSFAIVSTFFYHEDPSNYTLWIVFFTAGAAFVKIALAIAQALRTRKNHSVIIHHIKLADTANALVSIALTQRAILYFVGNEFAKGASGVGGIFFSILAGTICLSMFLSRNKMKE